MKEKSGFFLSDDETSSEDVQHGFMHVAAVKAESSNEVKIEYLAKQLKKLKGVIKAQHQRIAQLENALSTMAEDQAKFSADQQSEQAALNLRFEEFDRKINQQRTDVNQRFSDFAGRDRATQLYTEGFALQCLGDAQNEKSALASYQSALKKFLEICAGYPLAAFRVAEIYFKKTVIYDAEKSFQFALQAAMDGVPEAMVMVGRMHQGGVGTEKNLAEAFKWFSSATKLGVQDAGQLAANLVEFGQFSAKEVTSLAAQGGSSKSMKGENLSQKPKLN